MNCKQGEMAFIVKSMAGNEGKIVTCIRLSPGHLFFKIGEIDAWEVDVELPSEPKGTTRFVPDAWLRPIRPGDMEDEVTNIKELEIAQ